MSKPGRRLMAFIALSSAVHVAVLLVGAPPPTRIEQEGQPVHVTMSYLAGTASPESPAVDSPGSSRAHRQEPQETPRPTPIRKRRHQEAPPQQDTAAVPLLRGREAENAPDPGQAAAASGGADTDRRAAGEELRRCVLHLVHSRLSYPLLARRKGWEGIVKLELHIESDGRISRLRVEQTSGYPLLDRAALQSLRLASVPGAEQWMQGQAIDIIIPVEYRLVGG